MSILIIVLIALIVITGVSSYFIISKAMARKSAILKEAEAEGEMIKKERILQAKEKFIQLKSEHDRVVNERNQKLYQQYAALAEQEENTIFGGRLAEYKYYDMDDVIKSALERVKIELAK